MKFPTLAVAVLGLASALAAQNTDGEVIAVGYPKSNVGGGLFVIDAVKGTLTPMTGVTSDLMWSYSVAVDPWNTTQIYVGTNGADQSTPVDPNIYRIIATGGKMITAQKLNSAALTGDSRILDLEVVGNEIFFLTNTRFARMPITGGVATTIAKALYRYPVMCSDGRYLYCNFDSGGFNKDVVYQIDPQDTTHWQAIFSLPLINLSNILSLEMAADGQILVLDKGNFSGPDLNFVDTTTGKSTKKMSFFPPHFTAWKCVEDGKTRDLILFGSGNEDQVSIWSSKGVIQKGPFGSKTGYLKGLSVRPAPWLHRSGFACKPSTTANSLSANSLPESGNLNYALKLTAKANTPGLFLLGLRWQLTKPVVLTALGMGNCELGVLPLISFPVFVPATGSLDVPLPIASVITGANIDVQALLLDSKANSAGYITTQVGSVIIR